MEIIEVGHINDAGGACCPHHGNTCGNHPLYEDGVPYEGYEGKEEGTGWVCRACTIIGLDEHYAGICHALDAAADEPAGITRPCARTLPVSEERCEGTMTPTWHTAPNGATTDLWQCGTCRYLVPMTPEDITARSTGPERHVR